MLITEILRAKGDLVFTIGPTETIAAAAIRLHERRVGALVVLDGEDAIKGIVSERDVVRAVARQDGQGLHQPISEVMTREVVYADPRETIDHLLARMTDRRIRHLPVCEGGRLIGLVSIGDLVKAKIAETLEEASSLKAYIAAG